MTSDKLFTELYSDTFPQMKVYPAWEVDNVISELKKEIDDILENLAEAQDVIARLESKIKNRD